jgi:hypothetical protein
LEWLHIEENAAQGIEWAAGLIYVQMKIGGFFIARRYFDDHEIRCGRRSLQNAFHKKTKFDD